MVEQPPKIAVLDDEEGILHCLERHFRRERYAYLCSTDPDAAIAWIIENKPNIVISDYRMERINGVDFLIKVREVHPTAIRVLLSGMADEDRIQKALQTGDIQYFISKPWDPKTFKENLKKWLQPG